MDSPPPKQDHFIQLIGILNLLWTNTLRNNTLKVKDTLAEARTYLLGLNPPLEVGTKTYRVWDLGSPDMRI